jgi:hypothetical protein
MLQTKGVRVLTYFVAVLLIAWVVTIAFSHRQQSIAAFAFAVLGLSLLMPALRFELDGLWVDTIYYVAAALAAVMFFIAEEPEQTIVHLQTTLDEDSRSKVQSERKSLKLENEATKNAKHLAINTRFLQEISETLAQDWAKTLMAEEERLAGSLINSLKQLEFFAVWVAAENAQCVRTLDVLAMEQAFIRHEEEQRQQRSGFRNEIPDLSAGIQQEMFDRESDRCGRISTMQSRIDALGPGYERVIGLLDLSNDTYLTAALTGHASPSFVLRRRIASRSILFLGCLSSAGPTKWQRVRVPRSRKPRTIFQPKSRPRRPRSQASTRKSKTRTRPFRRRKISRLLDWHFPSRTG